MKNNEVTYDLILTSDELQEVLTYVSRKSLKAILKMKISKTDVQYQCIKQHH